MHWTREVVCSIAAAAVAATIGCGKSPQQQQAEQAVQQIAKSADSFAKGAENMAKGLEDMAKGLAGGGEGKALEPVSFRDLQASFPDLAGWEKGKASGEKMTSPVQFSQASVTYTKGDASIEAKIVDSGLSQLLIAPYAMMLGAGFERETDSGYEKAIKLGDFPAYEKWDKESKSGELNAIVGKRFIVTLEGRDVDDTHVLHQLGDNMNLPKLAEMK